MGGAQLMLGQIYFIQRKYENAKQAFEQYLALNPKEASAWNCMATDLVYLGRPIDALQAFEKALALDPCNSEVWRHKGKCLLDELDRYKEALEAYAQALALDTGNMSALIGKGLCLIRFGNTEEALQIFEQVLIPTLLVL